MRTRLSELRDLPAPTARDARQDAQRTRSKGSQATAGAERCGHLTPASQPSVCDFPGQSSAKAARSGDASLGRGAPVPPGGRRGPKLRSPGTGTGRCRQRGQAARAAHLNSPYSERLGWLSEQLGTLCITGLGLEKLCRFFFFSFLGLLSPVSQNFIS